LDVPPGIVQNPGKTNLMRIIATNGGSRPVDRKLPIIGGVGGNDRRLVYGVLTR
jgi:hypothetical protein